LIEKNVLKKEATYQRNVWWFTSWSIFFTADLQLESDRVGVNW